MDPKTSQRIFELAKDQQDELSVPDDEESNDEDEHQSKFLQPRDQLIDDDEDGWISDGAEDMGEAEEIFVRYICLSDHDCS